MSRISMSLLILASCWLTSISALADYSDDRATIKIQTAVGKAFAEDLTKLTKISGNYTALEIPNWLALTDKGILFGTPAASHLGEHELFISTVYGGHEYNFHFLLTVGVPAIPTKYELVSSVDEVFKADLSKLEGKTGTFTYKSLPVWIHAQSNGLLYGVPKKVNAGVSLFDVELNVDGIVSTFKVKLTVKDGAVKPVAIIKEGEGVSVNVFGILQHEIGSYYLTGPTWLNFHMDGELEGMAPSGSAGMHTISVIVKIETGQKHFQFYLQVVK